MAAFFQNLRAGRNQTVIVYGTSLTAGGAWAIALREWFDEHFPKQVKFVNSGGPGENSDWGVQNLPDRVLAHRPDLVFIEFSYNDAHAKFAMPLERGAKNLDTMVQALREKNSHVAIVLQTMNVGWDAPNSNRSLSSRPQLESFNENYRRYAREQRLPLLDHYQSWMKLKQENPAQFQAFIPDGSHPTKEGNLTVAWPAIRAFLEQARRAK
jgi:lysophospholipase L1-like esterase